jgi:two-component system phosphate regulon sensor histidine kinase PhoR
MMASEAFNGGPGTTMTGNLSLRLKLTLAYVTLAVVCTLALGSAGLWLQQKTYLDNLDERLNAEAQLGADLVLSHVVSGEPLAPVAARLAATTGARVTIIAADGRVLVDSAGQPDAMENHATRPEVVAALAGQRGVASRTSSTTGEASYYVAAPIQRSNQLVGALRLAVPLTDINRALRQIWLVVAGLTAVGAVITALITLAVTRILTVPLRELTALVRQAATGHLTDRLPVRTGDELGQLAQSFNQMAGELDRMIRAISDQRNEMSTILSGMTDGMLIVDTQQRVQRINQTAIQFFDARADTAIGRPLIEVARDDELVSTVANSLRTGQTMRRVLDRGVAPRVLSVTATPIVAGEVAGALVTLHDVSELRRLEQVRRQFVANISHELRTPLSNIKLMVETIQEHPADTQMATDFLDRINTEIDSLTQLVRELLELSRLESGQAPLALEWRSMAGLIFQVVERFRPQAERQGTTLTTDPSVVALPDVYVDPDRLQGVLVNLLHNAIKFTPPGGSITIGGTASDADVRVWVRDTGIGIAADEVARVFERFYKVDKARSTGGTGLGLAIVKHTIQAHGGQVWAESMPGEGSTFVFTLPISARSSAVAGRLT